MPRLGTPLDRMLRGFLTHEAALEAKKAELHMMIAMGSASFPKASARQTWNSAVCAVHTDLTKLLFGVDPDKVSDKDQAAIEFYEKFIKGKDLGMRKNEFGRVEVTGLPEALGQPTGKPPATRKRYAKSLKSKNG